MFGVLRVTVIVLCGVGCAFAQPEDGDIRLTGNGATSTQGRVEIYHDNQWGTVCDDQFDNADASIVCRQLGFLPASARIISNTFGQGTGPIWLDTVGCSGTEQRLAECTHNGWGATDCTHSEDIAVQCSASASAPPDPGIPTTTKAPNVVQDGNCTTKDDKIRIIGPSDKPGTGVVQVYNDATGQWGGVCDDGWDVRDARVVCRSLCYDASKSIPGSVAFDISNITEPMTTSGVNCFGNETSIVNCSKDDPWVNGGGVCTPGEKARVTCQEIDTSPPARPDPVMKCTDGRISASFSTITDPYLEAKHLSVDTSYNGPCDSRITNTTDYITISVPFDECGTNASANATHIIYKTQIKYLPTSSSGAVSTSNTYIFKIQCELPRAVDAGKPILPVSETITQRAPGNFDVTMSFSRDPLFTTRETNFPLEVPLGAMLGGLVEMRQVDQNTRLVVPQCYATPTNDRVHRTNYSLFTDKCADDSTVGFINWNDSTYGWIYKTFKFTNYPEVHIHCDALICLTNDVDPECDRSCLKTTTTTSTTPSSTVASGTGRTTASGSSGRRRKRSAPLQRIHLSSPTIIVYDPHYDGSIITRGEETTIKEPVLQTTSLADTNTVIQRSTAQPSSSKHPVHPENAATAGEAVQTLPPPYLGELDTVITGDGSGSGAIVSNMFLTCLVIIAYNIVKNI